MAFDEQLERAFDTLTARLQEEVTRQVRAVSDQLMAAARAEHVVPEHGAAIERGALTDRLADGVRSIGRARSLSEVLDTLASSAGREASRVGIFVVRGSRFRGWRFIGFGSAFDVAEQIDISGADAGVIADAVRTGAAASADSSDRTAVPAFADLPPGHDCAAVPLLMGGQVVAVLYADQGVTSLDTLDVLARHAARCLESLTAIKAARALSERPDRPAAAAAGTNEDSADGHAAARRYARLLVSEIKLYHEAQVTAGRHERDLATRLGGEIARARVLYEDRVPSDVRQNSDYFHAELVRTLADGDTSLLEGRT